MAGRPARVPNLDHAGGRVAWLRRKVAPPMTQGELAEVLGYEHQSGVGNLERSKTIAGPVAVDVARFFRERLALDVTPEWLIRGGDVPQPLPASRETPPVRVGLDARVAALPDVLQEYALQSIALAESVQHILPANLLLPPTSESYAAFHQLLTVLAATIRPGVPVSTTGHAAVEQARRAEQTTNAVIDRTRATSTEAGLMFSGLPSTDADPHADHRTIRSPRIPVGAGAGKTKGKNRT